MLDIHDGELEPTLENRKKITRLIREWKADIVISHRPWDYHPDHRYVGVLVQDAAFMVTVPFFCPDTPPLTKNPVFLYSSDGFQKPYPFQADIAVSIDDVFDQKLDAHSRAGVAGLRRRRQRQRGVRPQRPAGQRRRRPQGLAPRALGAAARSSEANRARAALTCSGTAKSGAKPSSTPSRFEICEYGRRPTPEEIKKLFPFFD